MNRSFIAALCLGVAGSGAAAGPVSVIAEVKYSQPRNFVDLGRGDVLDRIRETDPQRYNKILRVLEAASDVSCETLPQVLKVQYGAGDVRCEGAMLLTSLPAKRHVGFSFADDSGTYYHVNVVLSGKPGKLQPAK